MTTIPTLPPADMINPDDEFVISQGGESKRVTFSQMLTSSTGSIVSSFIGDGTVTPWSLGVAPGSNAVDVYISGVWQRRSAFNVAGSSVIPLQAWPLGSQVDIVVKSNDPSVVQGTTGISTTVITLTTNLPTIICSVDLGTSHAVDFVVVVADQVTGVTQTSHVSANYGPTATCTETVNSSGLVLASFDVSSAGGFLNLIADAVSSNSTKYTVTATAFAL